MALLQSELKITNLADLFNLNLSLPTYQRPYVWSVKSTITLFIDTYEAFKEGVVEYRLGSIIFHKVSFGEYNIVDGQQRLTTLSILLFSLGNEKSGLLKEKFSKQSNDAILNNYYALSKRIKEMSTDERKKYEDFLLNQCTMVQIVTDNEQEAFQFFDSQNSRGKELAPHDLLKSYHLREMNNEDEQQKIKIINSWENQNQNNLYDLFKNYLYPLTQWYKGGDGLGYTSSKIDTFKGIKGVHSYNYAIYHKASSLYVERFNCDGSNELLATKKINQFQLNQPFIAGKRFFYYTLHYGELLEQIQKTIKRWHVVEQVPSIRSGDIYILRLYECLLLFYADRFGFEHLTPSAMQQLYTWCYSLRLAMNAIYLQTINKYAVGMHMRANYQMNMFAKICEIVEPEELNLIVLTKPEIYDGNEEKYKVIYETLCEWNGW